MGLLNQAIRDFKQLLRNIFRSLFGKKKRTKDEPVRVPESWMKQDEKPSKQLGKKPVVVVKYKKRIPGLKTINRILAGIMLLFNLVFSQFLLGSVGVGAQPMFLFFLLNSYIIFRYIWITRKKESS